MIEDLVRAKLEEIIKNGPKCVIRCPECLCEKYTTATTDNFHFIVCDNCGRGVKVRVANHPQTIKRALSYFLQGSGNNDLYAIYKSLTGEEAPFPFYHAKAWEVKNEI